MTSLIVGFAAGYFGAMAALYQAKKKTPLMRRENAYIKITYVLSMCIIGYDIVRVAAAIRQL